MALSTGYKTESSVHGIIVSCGGALLFPNTTVTGFVCCDTKHFHKIHYLFSNNFLSQLKMYVHEIRGLARSALDLLFSKISISETVRPCLTGRGSMGCGAVRFVSIRIGSKIINEREHGFMMRVRAHRTMLFKGLPSVFTLRSLGRKRTGSAV